MTEAMRYLRRRRERGRRRVLAITLTCVTGATALTVAFGALLATDPPVPVIPLLADLSTDDHQHTTDSAGAATEAHSTHDAHPPAAEAPGRPVGDGARGGDAPTTPSHAGDESAGHSHGGG